jgi:ribosomal protein RSM22 (predicted rRNA methylase)
MALLDKVSVIVDQQLLIDTKDDEPINSNSSSMRNVRNVRIACITSILQVGICCSDEVPTDRPSIRDALKELQAIRDKFQKHLCLKGRS